MKISKKTATLILDYCELVDKMLSDIGTYNCTGKYKGTRDYSIQFTDGTEKFISNGKKSFDSSLENQIKSIKYFNENKDRLLDEISLSLDIPKAELDLKFDKEYFFVCIEYKGLLFTESSFSCYCKLEEYIAHWDPKLKRSLSKNFYLQN